MNETTVAEEFGIQWIYVVAQIISLFVIVGALVLIVWMVVQLLRYLREKKRREELIIQLLRDIRSDLRPGTHRE